MEQALMQMGHLSSSFQLQQQPIEATSQDLADTQPGTSQQVALFIQPCIFCMTWHDSFLQPVVSPIQLAYAK